MSFSVTDIADAMILSGLLHHLFKRNIVLVTTSNTRPDDLYQDGLQRARFFTGDRNCSKIHTHVLNVDSGKDYRMEYLQGPRYFFIRHWETGADISHCGDCFRWTGGEKTGMGTRDGPPSQARDIEIVALGPGVIWFDFSHPVPDPPLKNWTTLKIAKTIPYGPCSPIFLPWEMIKTMPPGDFIELIDEFYDRNVNLVVSSAQPLDRIYTGKTTRRAIQKERQAD